mgnify:CR=1 FL=1
MSKITVLLVDDHEGFINAALRHLRKVEWLEIVGRASNGLEAIERSETLRPDVVLMDLAMPEMGGLQATRLIKTQDAPPFIVIASHFDDAEHREHAMRAGADDFVSKLSYIQEVLPILEKFKDRRHELLPHPRHRRRRPACRTPGRPARIHGPDTPLGRQRR